MDDLEDVENSNEFSMESVLRITATLTGLMQFLAGSEVVRRFRSKKSTGDSSSIPFVAGALNCAIWTKYGFAIGENSMIILNLLGTIILIGCVIGFYHYS